MKCIDRYEQYKDEGLDLIMVYIKKGKIKAGKYAHLVKVDKAKSMNGRKEFFNDNSEIK